MYVFVNFLSMLAFTMETDWGWQLIDHGNRLGLAIN